MKTTTLRALVALLSIPCAVRAFTLAPQFYQPGNNAFFTAQPDPSRPGYGMDGVALIRTELQNEQAVTTYAGFPAGTLNNAAGITVLVLAPGSIAAELNALNLTVGSPVLSLYHPGVFTDVFGIAAPGVVGFGGSAFVASFGIAGSPIWFAADGPHQDANRFINPAPFAAGWRASYASNPLAPAVPDGGITLAMLLGALGVLAAIRDRRGKPFQRYQQSTTINNRQ